jgi:hypothetical protein
MQHEGSVAADAIKASFPVGRNYTEHDPIAAAGVTACGYSGMRIFVPSVDLCEHGSLDCFALAIRRKAS